jgi:LysR family transcriptional regulator, hydrogen peroxide-inducible genes activator
LIDYVTSIVKAYQGKPMKLRDLSYLVALSKTLHFGKAAELVHVSQPTLSVQIKKLEERLGVILVERNNKNVRLTPEGKIIAAKAERVFIEIEGIKTYAETLKDPLAGDITLGIIPTLGPYLLPKIIPGLHSKFPKLAIWLHEDQTEVLLKKLHQGECDLAILSLPIQDDSLTIIPLFDEAFLLAVNIQHKLAKKKSVIPQDIENEKILLLSQGHCFRDQALSVCNRVNTQPVSFQATSLETLRHMVAENLGLTFMPAMAAQISNPAIVNIPFKKPAPSRPIVLAFRKTHVRGALFEKMAKLIDQQK